MQVEVTEKNPGGYLSAAEIPLSRLYIGMAGVFFTAAMVWVYTLMKHRYTLTPYLGGPIRLFISTVSAVKTVVPFYCFQVQCV